MVLGEYLLRQVSAVEQLQQMSHFKVPDSTTSLASFFPSFLPLSPSHPQKSRKRHLQKLLRSCMASLGAFYCMIGKPPELCDCCLISTPFSLSASFLCHTSSSSLGHEVRVRPAIITRCLQTCFPYLPWLARSEKRSFAMCTVTPVFEDFLVRVPCEIFGASTPRKTC